ncbi:MAG: hypothetical protein K8I27_09785 [Planctomycetes bacterium]|nr:hypothetical protein [Planctomycetota bacterium]
MLRIAAIEGDIGADLRVAYKITGLQERMGLLEAAGVRADPALVQEAAAGLSDSDERLSDSSRDYLLSLPLFALTPDTSKLDESAIAAWIEFENFRIRLDLSKVLLEAHLKPGKYFGQFEALRNFDNARIDAELMRLVRGDSVFAEALNQASIAAIESNARPESAFQNSFRRLRSGAGAFAPVLTYIADMRITDALQSAINRAPRSRYLAALEVFGNVRAAAVRALGGSPDATALKLALQTQYELMNAQQPEADVAHLLNLDATRVEIEVALARLGDNALLAGRIASLRTQIERVQQLKVNVNMNVNSRPDLIAQNEIAHLLLRAGELDSAEREWTAAADGALIMLRQAEGRNRSSLSSYLGAVYYNLACAQSLQLKSSKALESLKKAVEHGYNDFAWMLEDGDLYEVRHHAGFAAWFENVAPPSVADRLRTGG